MDSAEMLPARDPASLSAAALLEPLLVEGDRIAGVRVRELQEKSFYEHIGLEEGDIILELNGLRMDNGSIIASIRGLLSHAPQIDMRVKKVGGPIQTIHFYVGAGDD